MNKTTKLLIALSVVAVAGAGAWYLYKKSKTTKVAPRPNTATAQGGSNVDGYISTASGALALIGNIFGGGGDNSHTMTTNSGATTDDGIYDDSTPDGYSQRTTGSFGSANDIAYGGNWNNG